MNRTGKRVIIRDRRFVWLHDDGRLEPVVINDRMRGQLCQTKAMLARGGGNG